MQMGVTAAGHIAEMLQVISKIVLLGCWLSCCLTGHSMQIGNHADVQASKQASKQAHRSGLR